MSSTSGQTPSPPTSSRAVLGYDPYFDSPPSTAINQPNQSKTSYDQFAQGHEQQVWDGSGADRPPKRTKPQPSDISKRRAGSGPPTAFYSAPPSTHTFPPPPVGTLAQRAGSYDIDRHGTPIPSGITRGLPPMHTAGRTSHSPQAPHGYSSPNMIDSQTPRASYYSGTSMPMQHGYGQPSSVVSPHPPTDFPPRPYGPGEGPPPKARGKIRGSEMDFLPFLEQRVNNVDRGIQRYYQMRAEKAKENADIFHLEEQNKKNSKHGSSSANH